jgi:quercetin dioxygenase-like cupin family protein
VGTQRRKIRGIKAEQIEAEGESRLTEPSAHFLTIADLEKQQAQAGNRYLEFLRVPTMSAGVYVLPAGGSDLQRPHRQDEIYYVIRGRARFQADKEDQEISAGSVLFVAAGVVHRFYDIVEELAVFVVFAPAET